MTKEDGLNLFNALNKLGYLSGVKFAYAVSKNMGLLKSEADSLTKANEPYENARIELAKKYSKKDEKNDKTLR